MMVNEDQFAMGVMSAEYLLKNMGGATSGKILEVRGLPGNSVDRDRHLGFRSVMEKEPNKFEIVEVVGNWAPGDSQKVTADALAVHKKFDAVFSQGGTNGTVQALVDAGHPPVPVAGEAENGFRKQIAAMKLKGLSYGQSPGPRRHLDQGGDLGARGQRHAAADLDPDPGGRRLDVEGRRELLVGPARQLLHAERVPAVRREHHRARDHGQDRGGREVAAGCFPTA
jgi:hypothetical protein